MPAAKPGPKKRRSNAKAFKSGDRQGRVEDDCGDLFDPALLGEINGLLSPLRQSKESKGRKDRHRKKQANPSVSAEINSTVDELKATVEKEARNCAEAVSKSSKESELFLKTETAKFHAAYEKFTKANAYHLQAYKGPPCRNENRISSIAICQLRSLFYVNSLMPGPLYLTDTMSRYEEEKEKLLDTYRNQWMGEKSMISEQEKACASKMANLEASLKRKQDETFTILQKRLGSFMETASGEDLTP